MELIFRWRGIEGGYLRLYDNNKIISFGTAFASLKSIASYLQIDSNDAGGSDSSVNLNMDGAFSQLDSIGGYFLVSSNNAMKKWNAAFPSLRFVGGYFKVNSNSYLTTLGGAFPSLEHVGEYFYIVSNGGLESLESSFGALTQVDEWFRIYDNDKLSSLGSSFSSLKAIKESFKIDSNDATNRFDIDDQPFASLESVGATFDIINNGGLRWMNNSFPRIVNVTGHLKIENNAHLLGMENIFESTDSVGAHLYLYNNDNQVTMNRVFPALTTHKNSELRIGSLEDLVSIDGFQSLASANFIRIYDNPKLERISNSTFGKLQKLTDTSEGFMLYTNAVLRSAPFLPEGLDYTGARVYVHNNPQLVDISGLIGLNCTGTSGCYFELSLNAQLSEAQVCSAFENITNAKRKSVEVSSYYNDYKRLPLYGNARTCNNYNYCNYNTHGREANCNY